MPLARWYIPPREPGSRVTVRVGTTPVGTGVVARRGVGTTTTREVSFDITSVLPGSRAPSLTLTDAPDIDEHGCIILVVDAIGGIYDQIDLYWEVVLDPISVDVALNDISTLDEDQQATLIATTGGSFDEVAQYYYEITSGNGCLVEYFGDDPELPPNTAGPNPPLGCFVPYFSKEPIQAPNMSLTNIGTLAEDDYTTIIGTPFGGLFDSIGYEWEIVSGGGCLVEYFDDIQAPDVSLIGIMDIREDGTLVLIADISGGLYDYLEETPDGDVEYEWEVVSGGGCIVEYFVTSPIEAPDLLLPNPTTIDENRYPALTVTPTGGLFDEVAEYRWEVVSGGGCLVEYFNFVQAPILAITDVNSITEDRPSYLDITPSGGLYDEDAEYEIEIVTDSGVLYLQPPPREPNG